MLRRGQGGINPRSLELSKETAQPRLQQLQRFFSGTTAPALRNLVFLKATVLLCSCMCVQCSPGDISIHALKSIMTKFISTYNFSTKHASLILILPIQYAAALGVHRHV